MRPRVIAWNSGIATVVLVAIAIVARFDSYGSRSGSEIIEAGAWLLAAVMLLVLIVAIRSLRRPFLWPLGRQGNKIWEVVVNRLKAMGVRTSCEDTQKMRVVFEGEGRRQAELTYDQGWLRYVLTDGDEHHLQVLPAFDFLRKGRSLTPDVEVAQQIAEWLMERPE
jgi:hypothetical protein